MHQIIYLSQATAPFGNAQLQSLVQRVRVINAQHGITGLLLYGNEQFLQVLEGERAALHARYVRIQQDARHRDITTLADKAVAARAFPTWHMAFTPLPQQPSLELADYLSTRETSPCTHNSIQVTSYLQQLLMGWSKNGQ